MQRRLIAFFIICICLLPVRTVAEDDVAPPATELEERPVTLWQPCYMRCLDAGHYAHICEGICEHTASKSPEKRTNNQYECYQSCTTKNNWGALFCLSRCRKWAETLESQDVDLPPEPGVQ